MRQTLGKLLALSMLTLGLTVATLGTAHAQRDGGEQASDQRGGRNGESRGRGGREVEQRRPVSPQDNFNQTPSDDRQRGGRMSPEERRELRRQIDEEGRNIYAPRGR